MKVLRFIFHLDLSWAEGPRFQSFISFVILLNTLTLGLELDIGWTGWFWLEQAMLVVYTFELAVRLKCWGLRFFSNPDWTWNWLDFIIVIGGVCDQWLIPALSLLQGLITGHMRTNSFA